ncbi:hypothetical protein RFI_11834 [Reticulomyxa filosa]|uniref:Uncharacterized protein n=1 Tax=Reticulomyxa filosa TaxID=46433 RepID=X6NHT2_RETFI|nr:hypothetical protein RFI_11834 [Reticulomyxa filosa]|eukprot:ETO25299.1 hypothetical protein RFI_11834 [Reticulomyxa filosa]
MRVCDVATVPSHEVEKKDYTFENKDITNLRCYIRSVCSRLCKQFVHFVEPILKKDQLTLVTIRENHNQRDIPTVNAFLEDIDRLVDEIKQLTNPQFLKDRLLLNEACLLQDTALSMVYQVDRGLADRCLMMEQAAKERKLNKLNPRNYCSTMYSNSSILQENKTVSNTSPPCTDLRPQDTDTQVTFKENTLSENINLEKVPDIATKADLHCCENFDNVDDVTLEKDISQHSSNVLELDNERLQNIINKLVQIAYGHHINFNDLQDQMYQLLKTVYKHSYEWNKDELLEDLEKTFK